MAGLAWRQADSVGSGASASPCRGLRAGTRSARPTLAPDAASPRGAALPRRGCLRWMAGLAWRQADSVGSGASASPCRGRRAGARSARPTLAPDAASPRGAALPRRGCLRQMAGLVWRQDGRRGPSVAAGGQGGCRWPERACRWRERCSRWLRCEAPRRRASKPPGDAGGLCPPQSARQVRWFRGSSLALVAPQPPGDSPRSGRNCTVRGGFPAVGDQSVAAQRGADAVRAGKRAASRPSGPRGQGSRSDRVAAERSDVLDGGGRTATVRGRREPPRSRARCRSRPESPRGTDPARPAPSEIRPSADPSRSRPPAGSRRS